MPMIALLRFAGHTGFYGVHQPALFFFLKKGTDSLKPFSSAGETGELINGNVLAGEKKNG